MTKRRGDEPDEKTEGQAGLGLEERDDPTHEGQGAEEGEGEGDAGAGDAGAGAGGDAGGARVPTEPGPGAKPANLAGAIHVNLSATEGLTASVASLASAFGVGEEDVTAAVEGSETLVLEAGWIRFRREGDPAPVVAEPKAE